MNNQTEIKKPISQALGMADPPQTEILVEKHSLTIAGHRTSISLEKIFWNQMKEHAMQQNRSLASLVSEIDCKRGEANLSSAIRVFVLRSALSK